MTDPRIDTDFWFKSPIGLLHTAAIAAPVAMSVWFTFTLNNVAAMLPALMLHNVITVYQHHVDAAAVTAKVTSALPRGSGARNPTQLP
ncbi:hypothetical protein H9P43_002169 [Blastocladiella emersonii ATCC 22665]|nr:hypothetical protein H9P43_002169 [Blastocladiella emersonii ATCC 22665]